MSQTRHCRRDRHELVGRADDELNTRPFIDPCRRRAAPASASIAPMRCVQLMTGGLPRVHEREASIANGANDHPPPTDRQLNCPCGAFCRSEIWFVGLRQRMEMLIEV